MVSAIDLLWFAFASCVAIVYAQQPTIVDTQTQCSCDRKVIATAYYIVTVISTIDLASTTYTSKSMLSTLGRITIESGQIYPEVPTKYYLAVAITDSHNLLSSTGQLETISIAQTGGPQATATVLVNAVESPMIPQMAVSPHSAATTESPILGNSAAVYSNSTSVATRTIPVPFCPPAVPTTVLYHDDVSGFTALGNTINGTIIVDYLTSDFVNYVWITSPAAGVTVVNMNSASFVFETNAGLISIAQDCSQAISYSQAGSSFRRRNSPLRRKADAPNSKLPETLQIEVEIDDTCDKPLVDQSPLLQCLSFQTSTDSMQTGMTNSLDVTGNQFTLTPVNDYIGSCKIPEAISYNLCLATVEQATQLCTGELAGNIQLAATFGVSLCAIIKDPTIQIACAAAGTAAQLICKVLLVQGSLTPGRLCGGASLFNGISPVQVLVSNVKGFDQQSPIATYSGLQPSAVTATIVATTSPSPVCSAPAGIADPNPPSSGTANENQGSNDPGSDTSYVDCTAAANDQAGKCEMDVSAALSTCTGACPVDTRPCVIFAQCADLGAICNDRCASVGNEGNAACIAQVQASTNACKQMYPS